MIERYITKDVGSFQTKFLGPFTFRQTVCLTLSAPICWSIYKYLSPVLSTDLTGFLIFIPASIAVAVGWLRPYGMPVEKFLKSVIISMVLAPRDRKYRTVNQHELRIQQMMQQEETPRKKKAKYTVSKQAVR